METDEGPTTNMADDEDAQPEVLLPCAVCGRKFNPRSLDKHVKICERTATKKRKPFDSAKQRIQGTELAEFLPKQQQQSQQSHHHHHHHHHHNHNNSHQQQQQQHQSPYSSDARLQRPAASSLHQDSERRRPSQAWKQSRDEFLRAIRAARGDTSQRSPKSQSHGSQSQQQQQSAAAQRPSTLSLVTSTGAPMRSNEKGQCPTCQRQFGLKSYDRHVAFCRERATRLPASPQTTNNVAKERLEARMKYRAPALRNRRPTNREKYSPGGAGMNRSGQSPLLSRSPMKDQLPGSAPSSNSPPAAPATLASTSTKNSDTASPKLPVLKRPGQTNKESPTTPSGPLKSRPMDRSNSGASKDYDPFLLAEQQLNDLFSDTSDQSSTDGSSICPKPNSSPNFPLSHSSAFVKYPNSPKPSIRQSSQSAIPPSDSRQPGSRRLSVIAPPLGFDDLTSSDLSSDCTETHSLSREPLTSSSASASLQAPRELGRRLIIDQSQALGGGEFAPEPSQPSAGQQPSQLQSSLQPNGTVRPLASRSNSLRVAPRPPERKLSSSSSSASSEFARKPCPGVKQQQQQPSGRQASAPAPIPNQRALNGCRTTNGASSSLSLSSIISDVELKRSNSLFDELLSSFEEDTCLDSTSTLPSLMSLMRNESGLSLLSSSTGGQQQQPSTPAQQNGLNGHHARGTGHNGRIQCSDDDAELSSPESVKRQECGKLSADSAYSSLNRKYLHNGRSANELNGSCKYKLSKFCHECGFKFPDSAKFCCECGVKRLTL